ncbi:MAG: site-2 protease family protein, partial [Lentisphaerae bacterium]|nr:site-2 protease family protein [Lentisphaerota bacterium]
DIVAVNGKFVRNWQEMLERAMHHEEPVFSLQTPEGQKEIPVRTQKSNMGIKIVTGIAPTDICQVETAIEGLSAEQAGILPGDRIQSFNNQKVFSVLHMIELVAEARDQEVPVSVLRNGELISLTVTPEYDEARDQVMIGIKFAADVLESGEIVHIPPGEQIKRHATAIFRVLGMLVQKKTMKTTAQGLGGPIMIIYFFQNVVRQGLAIALWFTCFINVNLAILNLLPIPVLDGGHVVFNVWEMITRKRVHPKVFEWSSQFFAWLLITAIILLSFKDAKLLLKLHGVFAPKNQEEAIIENHGSEEAEVDREIIGE